MPKSLPKVSRSKGYHKKGLWAIKKKNGGKWPAQKPKTIKEQYKTETKAFGKKGQTRKVSVPKTPGAYHLSPQEPKVHKKIQNAPKIRDSLQTGTVAIVLSGRFRGRRVVVVKRLASGLVLVTGPFKINGVPLRRVNPAYLIATSTKVDGLKFDADTEKALSDNTFKRPKSVVKAAEVKEGEKKVIDPARLALQKAVDSGIVTAVKTQPLLTEYLHAHFSLEKGQYPHALKF